FEPDDRSVLAHSSRRTGMHRQKRKPAAARVAFERVRGARHTVGFVMRIAEQRDTGIRTHTPAPPGSMRSSAAVSRGSTIGLAITWNVVIADRIQSGPPVGQ